MNIITVVLAIVCTYSFVLLIDMRKQLLSYDLKLQQVTQRLDDGQKEPDLGMFMPDNLQLNQKLDVDITQDNLELGQKNFFSSLSHVFKRLNEVLKRVQDVEIKLEKKEKAMEKKEKAMEKKLKKQDKLIKQYGHKFRKIYG